MRLTLLTPAPDEPRFAAIAQTWLDRLSRPLAAEGISVSATPWTDWLSSPSPKGRGRGPGEAWEGEGLGTEGQASPTQPLILPSAARTGPSFSLWEKGSHEAVSPLLAWGYHQKPEEWAALLERLAAHDGPVVNRPADLAWNTRKTYLAELEAKGAPIVPTLFVDAVTPEAVAEARGRFGGEIILKPQVSAGAFDTVRLTPGETLSGGPAGPAMLQPFLPAVSGEGELSLLFFGGVFSHAVAKRAKAGDFRVQVQYGGLYAPFEPSAEAMAAAKAVLAASGRDFTYARIDLIRDRDGALKLMELEALEPDLYLEHAPDGGAAFARAVRGALG